MKTLKQLLDDAWDVCNTGPVDPEVLSEEINKALKTLPKEVLDLPVILDNDEDSVEAI